jgi:hypothetical protein
MARLYRDFVSKAVGTTQHEVSISAELIHDAEDLAPGKLRQSGEQTLERAWSFLNQE